MFDLLEEQTCAYRDHPRDSPPQPTTGGNIDRPADGQAKENTELEWNFPI